MEFGQNAGTQYGPNDDTFAYNKFINNSCIAYVNVTGTFACTAARLRFWNNVIIENGNSRHTGANFGKDVLGDGQSFTTWTYWPIYPKNPTVDNSSGWRPFQYGSDAGVVADTLFDIRNNVIWNNNGLIMKYSGRTKIKYRNNIYKLGGTSTLGATLSTGEILTTNKIFTDTSYANPFNWNFHLQAGSPAINAGMYVGISPDWDGAITTNPPSVGIYNANYIPVITTSPAVSISQTSAIIGGNITSDGNNSVTRRGLIYSTSNITDTTSTIGGGLIINGNGTGAFTSTISSLIPNTTYYVKAFAINSVGISYSTQIYFKTLAIIKQFTNFITMNIFIQKT
jgi:hypothetical protein